MNLRFKKVMRKDEIQGHFRLFRFMWERGQPGIPGGGHSNMVSIAVEPRLFNFHRDGERHWQLTLLGIRVHRKVSYGGKFA